MNRLYVLSRLDLPGTQPYVQAIHAVAAWCHNESCRHRWDGRDVTTAPWRWNNEVLVVLGVRDEQELREWYERLRVRGPGQLVEQGAVAFHEPFYDNQMTAFACVGKREEFDGLPLLR